MPVRRAIVVGRRHEPSFDADVGPGFHGREQDRASVVFGEGQDLGVLHVSAHFPDFASVVTEGEGAFRDELFEGVTACGDGVAEGGAVGEVAVFGLGCCLARFC